MIWNESQALPSIPAELCGPHVLTASSHELSDWLCVIVQMCLKRVRRWQPPLNWARADWLKEVTAQGRVAALEALWQYDASKGRFPASFVMSRTTARVLARYRQEW